MDYAIIIPVGALACIGAGAGAWIAVRVAIARLEVRIDNSDKQHEHAANLFEMIRRRTHELGDMITELRATIAGLRRELDDLKRKV